MTAKNFRSTARPSCAGVLQRPEIIIPLVTTGGANRPAARFEGPLIPRVGSIVRLTNPTYLGAVGQVVSLPASKRGIHPGQLERLAKVDVQGTTLVLPFADIEVLDQDSRFASHGFRLNFPGEITTGATCCYNTVAF